MSKANAVLSRFPEYQIRALDGRLLSRTFVSRQSGGLWQWIADSTALHFDCRPWDVDSLEDHDGLEWITVHGAPVAYSQLGGMTVREAGPVAKPSYLEAAE